MLLDDADQVSQLVEELTKAPDGAFLLAEAHIGEDAAEFAKSDLGRYMIGRADQEIQDFTQQLQNVWGIRRKRIQWLQNEIFKRQQFKTYLLEAIQSGRSALAELSERQLEAQ